MGPVLTLLAILTVFATGCASTAPAPTTPAANQQVQDLRERPAEGGGGGGGY